MKINIRRGWLFAVMPVFFIGCVSQEEGYHFPEKQVSEIFQEMEKLPPIEDPDLLIEDLKYEEIFAEVYSLRVLAEVSPEEDPMPLHLKNLLQSIGEQLRDVAPELKSEFENTSLNDLINIMDPRVPLDPQQEKLLQELLEKLKTDLPFAEIPAVEGLEELRTVVKILDHLTPNSSTVESKGSDDSCAQGVYLQYGSGARACGLERNLSYEAIESNYLRRVNEAETRRAERNQQLTEFELEQLTGVIEGFRKILTSIREVSTVDEVKEIRANIGYFAAAYAYHLRLNVPLWHQYGTDLIEWHYYKELELIAEIRHQKEAEADMALQHCLNWVNGLIIEVVNKACPGDEPILY